MGQKQRHPRLKVLQASMAVLKPAPSQSRTPASSRKSVWRKAHLKILNRLVLFRNPRLCDLKRLFQGAPDG
jgi:hypothetical protein